MSNTAPTSGQVLAYNGTAWAPAANSPFSGSAAGGDLAGAYPNPSVVKLQGTSVASTVPTGAQVLTFDGTNWTPAAIAIPAGSVTTASLADGSVTNTKIAPYSVGSNQLESGAVWIETAEVWSSAYSVSANTMAVNLTISCATGFIATAGMVNLGGGSTTGLDLRVLYSGRASATTWSFNIANTSTGSRSAYYGVACMRLNPHP